ncbi:MAG: D-alanine--D-alanine ligase [Polyangiaceae bacterium UTPRO1]|jgi:D-alanine-D-alanine ligase|nr:ATP-grasp domain-containing protein [Myxococcales bacterium]OQY66696.1 MAG: D-alanine--D-alanine ligase [Polyangiaceae bacterium UTPRO1]
MPKLRVGVLYDATDSGAEEAAEVKSSRRKRRRPKHDHEEIYDALRKLGHDPFYHTLDGTPGSLHTLATERADLYFNLAESYAGDDTKEMHVAAYLELLGRRYTGAGPQGLFLAQDKALAKKIFAFHGIRTPAFMTGHRGRLEWAHDIHFPVIVKPGLEDGSIGIRFSAVVHSLKELMERIDQVHADFDGPVLIEEYIEGREIYVAVLGNQNPEALPIVELDLSQLPAGTPRIAGTEVKWEEGTEVYRRTQPFFPDDLDEELEAELKQMAIAAYQALRLRDYGRIDIRLDGDEKAYVIECNPNPWLLSTAELAKAAKKSGRSHCDLIAEITQLAIGRYGA